MKAQMSGIKELQRNLAKYSDKKSNELRGEVNKAALNIDRGAKKLVPVDTGRLRSSIHAVPVKSIDSETGVQTGDMEGAVVTNVEYAPKIETTQPYLFPSYESERKEFIANVKRVLGTR